VVFGGAQRAESAGGQVGRGSQAEVRAVHVRVRPGAELVQGVERGRHVRRMPVPVGDFDGPQNDIPAPVGVPELALQPVGRHGGVGVGGRQPDPGRVGARRQPQQFGHAGDARGADVAGTDADHAGFAGPRGGSRLIGAGVGHHQHVYRRADGAGGPPQRRHAGGQQRFLVVGGHDHASRLDGCRPGHTRPVAWATDTGAPSVRMYTSARKSGS
jgi:hypothetical protein